MRCRACGGVTRVINTEHRYDQTFRWLRCLACGVRTRTVETYYERKPGPPKGKPRKGQSAKGEAHPQSIFTDEDIRLMRSLAAEGQTLAKLAERYGISVSYASRIINRKVWTHLAP